MSRRGTTPTHTFELPFDTSLIKDITISYVQREVILFKKRIGDCTFKDNVITLDLSQEETLKFDKSLLLKIQLKVLFIDDRVDASYEIVTPVDDIYDEEVMS